MTHFPLDRPHVTIILLLGIILVLTLIRSYLLVDIGIAAFQYSEIKIEIDKQRRINESLREKILLKSSLQEVKEKALEKNMIPATYVYIVPTSTITPDKEYVSESTNTLKAGGVLRRIFYAGIIGVLLGFVYRILLHHLQSRRFYDKYVYRNKARRKARKHLQRISR